VKSQPDLQPFFRAAEALLAEHGPGAESFARVGALLRPLAADSNLVDSSGLAALHGSSAGFSILGHGDAGSTLMLARFRADAPTPVHHQTGRWRRPAAHHALGPNHGGLVSAYGPHAAPALLRAKARLGLRPRLILAAC